MTLSDLLRIGKLEAHVADKVEIEGEGVDGGLHHEHRHLPPQLLSEDPCAEGGRRVLFYSGDDVQARAEVGGLIERLGFFGIDLGSLAVGGRLVQFPGGPLPALNLVKFG